MVEVLKKNNHVIYCDFDHYFINKFYTFTTGDPPFAVCQEHTVKPQKPTANPLSCAILDPRQNKVASHER